MFKYLQRFPFIDEKRYLSQAINEEIELKDQSWTKNLNQILNAYGLSNLFKNIFQVTQGTIDKKDYKKKHKFFEKRAKDIYIQENFHTYLAQRNDLFNQYSKEYKIEKYLKLKSYKHRNAITKLKLSSNNLANNTNKWYKPLANKSICRFCTMGSIENAEHVTFECHKYSNIRTKAFNDIKIFDHIDLNGSDRKRNLHLLFMKGSLKSLNTFGQFINGVFETREQFGNESVFHTILL